MILHLKENGACPLHFINVIFSVILFGVQLLNISHWIIVTYVSFLLNKMSKKLSKAYYYAVSIFVNFWLFIINLMSFCE